MTIGETGAGAAEVQKMGLITLEQDGKMVLDAPAFNSPAQSLEDKFDFYVDDNPVVLSLVEIENERMAKEIFYIPALLLLLLVIVLQRRRQTVPAF